MNILPDYDEFMVYTTTEDIFIFMENEIKKTGVLDKKSLEEKSLKHFGSFYIDSIQYILENYSYKVNLDGIS